MKNRITFIFSIFLMSQLILAQSPETLKIRKYVNQNADNIVGEFFTFLSIPDVAANPAGLQKNAEFIMGMMNKRGIQKVQLLNATTTGVPPAVYGEVIVPGAKKTLIFYAHYDGQPVNPSQWAKDLSPFQPKLFSEALHKGGTNIPFPADGKYNNDWRIYARASSDDKGGIDAIINAYDALNKSGLKPDYNIKFFFEGEEEAGSPHLGEILDNYKSLLRSDLWIICDASMPQSGKRQILFGSRGDAHLDLTIYASKRPLHSGDYGNWAPNPAMMMAKLLASMKDDDGRVTIKGFYDDVTPLSPLERKTLAEEPSNDEQLKSELGINSSEMKGLRLNEAINFPSLNINGSQSGNVGKMATNQIPTYATAVLDLRLVLGNDWKRQQQKVIDHITAQGYYVIRDDREPTDEERKKYAKIIKVLNDLEGGENAYRTSMDLPIVKNVIEAVKSISKEQVVLSITTGATLPLFIFKEHLDAKSISIPIANNDSNVHAENENIRVGNLFGGIEIMGALMMMK